MERSAAVQATLDATAAADRLESSLDGA